MKKNTPKESFLSENYTNIINNILSDPEVRTTVKNGAALSKEVSRICRKNFLLLTPDDAQKYCNYLISQKRAYSTCIRKFRNLSALSAYLDNKKTILGISQSYIPVITMKLFFEKFGHRTATKGEFSENLSGKIFGQLKAIECVGKNKENQKLYLCECKCGGTRIVNEFLLIYGDVTDCGNSSKHPSGTNLNGKVFGFLKVMERDVSDKRGNAKWIVRCGLCGKMTSVSARNLLSGNTISCGCIRGKKRSLIEEMLENIDKYAIFW